METNEKLKIGEEILKNLLDFLKAESKLQFNSKNISSSDEVIIITEVISNLFLNNLINVSELLKEDPIKIYESFDFPEAIASFIRNKNET